jgi:molecular chaperone DnaJ
MAKRDFYEVLGINRGADDATIKKAYRTMAKKYHPDLNKEAGAEDKFKEVQDAYEVLSDSKKRGLYDQFGHAGVDPQAATGAQGFSGFGGFGNFSDINDIFSSIFNGGGFSQGGSNRAHSRTYQQQNGRDVFASLDITFEEAVFGVTKTIEIDTDETCPHCNGSGANSPSDVKTCSTCNGYGTVRKQQRTLLGIMETEAECPTCHGTGKQVTSRCVKCNGQGYNKVHKNQEFRIPAGINSGQQVRLEKLGERGTSGGRNGDMYIEIHVGSHPQFTREGKDLHYKFDISLIDAVLGGQLDVQTLSGVSQVNVSPGCQSGTTMRLRGKGVKDLRSSNYGDLIIHFTVVVPSKLSNEEKKLYEQIRDLSGKTPVPPSATKNSNKFSDIFKKSTKRS